MREIGVYDARTQFSRLVEDVERGEVITITRHGKPVARLVPLDGARRMTRKEAVDGLIEFGKTHRLGDDLTIRQLIDEGRRY